MELMTIFLLFVMLVQNFIGVILPPVIDFVNQYVTNSKVRLWVAFAICAVIASIVNYNYFLDVTDWNDVAVIAGKIGFIFTQAQLTYKQYWEKSQARIEVFGRGIVS
jgi:hypothetical protein